MMACNLCHDQFGPRRKATCASCARCVVYEPRLQQVSALLERENYHTLVEAIVRPGNDGVLASLPQDADWDAISQGIARNRLQRQRQELELANDKIASVVERVDDLKKQMTQYRDIIDGLKTSNEGRRAELSIRMDELSRNISAEVEPWETGIRKTRHRLQRTHQRSADAKAYLCYTASLLAGVRQEVDQRRKLTGRIMLGGLVVPDLREFNGPSSSASLAGLVDGDSQHFHHINACLDNICRLVTTWAHYLSISLLAEVILPHNDFPHAAILHEKASYRGYDMPYPGNTSSQDASPSTSRIMSEVQNTPRARLLHLDRPLAKLAKEDPKTFHLFIEGIVLLAWNIAWLCKTQGVTAINTFDEFCDIGRNLWLLHRAAEARAQEAASQQGTDTPSKASRPIPSQGVQFGDLTHGTVQHGLSGHEGAAIMQNWRLAQPHRLTDKLRSFLLTEMTGAEWDVLSDKDFDDDREDEMAVLVGGNRSRRPGISRPTAMSVMSVATPEAATTNPRHEKGWMRVRGRGTET